MYELYIVHSGILGMRWGVRRFQNRDGSLTAAGKARYSKGGDNPRHKDSNARKAAKQRAANLEKARKAKAEKAKFEADKKNALERGSATDIMKFKGKLTTKEMNDALSRLDAERRLSEISAKEIERGKITLKKITAKIDEARSAGESLTNAWNFIAKIHNSFADPDDAWQQIGQPSEAAKRAKREASAREDAARKDVLAKGVAKGKISADEFAELSKIRNNLSPKDLEQLVDKYSALSKAKAAEKAAAASNKESAKPKEIKEKDNSNIKQLEEKIKKLEEKQLNREVAAQRSVDINNLVLDMSRARATGSSYYDKLVEETRKKSSVLNDNDYERANALAAKRAAKINTLIGLMKTARSSNSSAADDRVKEFFETSGLTDWDYDLASEEAGKRRKGS